MRWTLLALALTWLPGCATVRKADEILAWTKSKIDAVDRKVEDLKAKQAGFEAVTGVWARDGDGNVTRSEVAEVVKSTVAGAITDEEKRSLLADPEFWGALALALAGAYAGKKGAGAAAKAIVRAGTGSGLPPAGS